MQSHDEFLALPDADVLPADRQVGLGLCDEPVALGLDLVPELGGKELAEGNNREALGADVGHDSLLHVVELRDVVREEAAALAIREHAVVELVGRADALSLEGFCHTVCTVREHPVHPM